MFKHILRIAVFVLVFALLALGGLFLALPAAAQDAAPVVTPVPAPVEVQPPVVVEQTLIDWRGIAVTAIIIVLGFLIAQFGSYVYKSAPPEVLQLLAPMLLEAVRVLQDFAKTTPNKIDDAAVGEILQRLEEIERWNRDLKAVILPKPEGHDASASGRPAPYVG